MPAPTFTDAGEVASGFQKRPAYRYLRPSDNLPTLDNLPDDGTALCPVKLFNPCGAATWWIASYDPDTHIAFGVADLCGEPEIGSFSMDEIVALRCPPFGLPIERDLHYTPKSIDTLRYGGTR